VPVTALTLAFNAIVFAGQGPYLKVYARASSELLWITRIFATQAIHGFAQTPRDANSGLSLLVWGGRSVCYCEVTVEESNKSRLGITVSITRKQVIRTRDWVFDATFRSRKGESLEPVTCAVIVTAHNELLELKVLDRDRSHGDGSALLQLNALFSGPRCGLYSASLSWLSPTQLLIASGTVFGEIVIWSLNSDGSSIEARRNYIFTGHEGSIFGVRISDKTALDDGTELRLLASCSDDRTIRIWNISDLSRGIKLDGEDLSEVERDSSRTTGFLNYVSEEAVTASKDLCVAVDMGHLSRIWDIRFAIERQDKGYISTIISVGEDATCQKWDLSYTGLEQTTFALSHIASNGYHEGKSIWSLATSDVSACPLVFTGGSDGKIVQHSSLVAGHTTETQHLQLSEWVIEDCLSALGNQDSPEMPITESRNGEISRTQPKLTKGKEKQDCFRSFACIGDSQLLLTTNDGLVLLATCTGAKQWAWKRIGSFGGLKGYSVACRLTAEPFEYVFFGDGRGNIYYYHSFFEEIKILTNIDGKVTKLMAEILPPKTHEYMSIVVTRHGGLPPVQLRVNLGTAGNLHVSTTKVFANWKEDSAPITSSCVVIHDSVEKGLIVGCRDGTIYSYSQPASASKREFDFELPFSHGKEAVTALVWKSHKGVQYNIWDPTFGWLFSVGRDGTLAVHFFPGYYENPYLVHRLALSFGPNLEGLAIDPHTSDVSVWGFTSKFFVCHNVSAMQDVVTVECGGAHRIWTFGPFEASTGLFAWVKASKLNVAIVNSASHEVMQSGGHGREIKACAVAPKSIVPGLGPLIATGSEDTNIAICYYADWHGSQKELKPLSVLRKHVTGIQALHWSSDGNFLFSSGGFEEFYVWHLRAVPAVTVGIVCESKCPLDSADSELRITDFAVRDISVCERMSRGDWMWVFLISMVYSNSSIKVSLGSLMIYDDLMILIQLGMEIHVRNLTASRSRSLVLRRGDPIHNILSDNSSIPER
jgi:WD40 repeat protein